MKTKILFVAGMALAASSAFAQETYENANLVENERSMLMPRVFPKRLGRVNSVTLLQLFKVCSISIVLSI